MEILITAGQANHRDDCLPESGKPPLLLRRAFGVVAEWDPAWPTDRCVIPAVQRAHISECNSVSKIRVTSELPGERVGEKVDTRTDVKPHPFIDYRVRT